MRACRRISTALWFAGLSGTVGAHGHEVSVDASQGDILSRFDIGLMGAMEARKKRLIVPFDLKWIKLQADKATPFDPGFRRHTGRAQQWKLTAALGRVRRSVRDILWKEMLQWS